MTDVAGNEKKWYQSKTIVINLLATCIGVATYILANYTPATLQQFGVSPNFANDVLKIASLFVGVGNIILRAAQSPTQITGQ